MMIDVHHLDYTYPGSPRPAVQDLSFHVTPGEIFGFLGPSGAGKSTTQRIFTGLLPGYEGSVRVFGRDLSALGAAYYERIGVSFELPNHFLRLTGAENLRYFAALYGGKTRDSVELLDMVGLADAATMPVATYSKGMKNRLTLARALLHDPELLFLDEPTNGLDPVNARRVRNLIRQQQAAGKTIFLTTHDMMVADALCDRVAFIVEGQITALDSPRRLKLAHGRATVEVSYLVGADGQQPAVACREFPLAGLGSNRDFSALLQETTVQTIHTQEATLEDVFVHVTGRRLR